MGRAKQAADRIREEIPIIQVLSDYGYAVYPDGEDREQQFSCDLHGDGMDNKPSARAYPSSASFHCWACGRSRDAITLVREKEGVEFWEAVKALESRYGLPPLPWVDYERPPKDTTLDEVSAALTTSKQSAAEILHRVERLVASLCHERECDPASAAALWEAHDRVSFLIREDAQSETVLKEAASRVLAHVRNTMKLSDHA